MADNAVNVLVIDDDDVAVMGLQRAFRKLDIEFPCFTASDGLEALELLRGKNGNVAIPKPHLMLLDLNMPRMDGFEFLEEIRNDPDLQQSVIFVLSTSTAEEDMARAYNRNVAGYIVKSNTDSTFHSTLAMLDQYRRIVELPC